MFTNIKISFSNSFFLKERRKRRVRGIKTFTARCGAFNAAHQTSFFHFQIEILYMALLFRNEIACGKSKYIKFHV